MRQDKGISHCNQSRLLQEEFEDTKGVIKIEGQITQWVRKNGPS
jgi:phosphoglycerate-specific signal transduction histidine kinase